MPSYFTRQGDEGFTSLLGKGRIPKDDVRLEAIGAVDEANSALGLSRALSSRAETKDILLHVQRDLYRLMAEVAATKENAEKFRAIDNDEVTWLEEQVEQCSNGVSVPEGFIVPGDTPAGAALDLARSVTRRAERRIAGLLSHGDIENGNLVRYLNRLSSLTFILELCENQEAGKAKPTLAKME